MTEKQKITVNDFKMWLTGVEEMQDEGWSPSPQQWTRIREKIEMLDASSTQQVINNSSTVTYRAPAPVQAPQHAAVTQPHTGAPSVGLEELLAPPQNLPANVPQSAAFLPPNPTMAARTPNIDTTDGNYKSSFV